MSEQLAGQALTFDSIDVGSGELTVTLSGHDVPMSELDQASAGNNTGNAGTTEQR